MPAGLWGSPKGLQTTVDFSWRGHRCGGTRHYPIINMWSSGMSPCSRSTLSRDNCSFHFHNGKDDDPWFIIIILLGQNALLWNHEAELWKTTKTGLAIILNIHQYHQYRMWTPLSMRTVCKWWSLVSTSTWSLRLLGWQSAIHLSIQTKEAIDWFEHGVG